MSLFWIYQSLGIHRGVQRKGPPGCVFECIASESMLLAWLGQNGNPNAVLPSAHPVFGKQ